ncbi:hypothetical protein EHF33_16075 [Deinococcus psychrotolerans]|uniref:Uncharacterized protein n=1 Tax=Deinococcus psychrotolerans TaxID=2489213 RepID=A0A3G8YP45_9DEIO|nr:hypothetical protein [Deinococcus psychrotolerans]AZI44394.1 hypothetical protein EHF33_16075 [Deinococcus psychrotolerans]
MSVDVNRGRFAFYPENQLIGVTAGEQPARTLLNELVALGIAETDLSVFSNEAGLRLLDEEGFEHGWLGHFRRWIQSLTDEREEWRTYGEALASGQSLVTLQIDRRSAAYQDALDAYHRAGATLIRYFGPAVIEEVD